MNSIVLSVQTLDAINDMLNEVTGYGSERKVNFLIKLTEEGEDLIFNLTHNDTGNEIFKGIIKQKNFVEAIKSEDKKQKEKEHSVNKN